MALQTEERAKAIAKIRKLRNQTTERGRTEGEASMAMEKMGELMAVFDITMNEVALSEIEYVQEHVALGSTKKNFMNDVLVRIGEFCGVIVWFDREPDTKTQWTANGKARRMMAYFFYGTKEDVEMALYLYETIESAVKNESAKYKKQLGKGHRRGYLRTATHGFQQGMISRINRELSDKTDERAEKRSAALSGTGNDLILAMDAKLNEKRKSLGLRTVYRQRHAGDWSARAAGNKAGANFNLNRPINGGRGGQKLLG